MAIIELSFEEFGEWINTLDVTKYKVIVTSDGGAVVKPTVSTRNLETFYIHHIDEKQIQELQNKFGNILKCSRYHFREDRL